MTAMLSKHGEVELPDGSRVSTHVHAPSGLVFLHVPGGSFVRGLSESEEVALRADLGSDTSEDAVAGLDFLDRAEVARPAQRVTVASFFLAQEPLNDDGVTALLGPDYQGILDGSLTLAEADRVVAALETRGLRLPSETEWELAYRAGSAQPFPWGTSRPTTPWAPLNALGFEGMGELAELCADGWQMGYGGAPTDGSARAADARPRVVRGGAAEVWPWQGVGEWICMLSAYRSPASQHDEFLRVRPAFSAPAVRTTS